jgi:hypothetical protein
MIGQEIKEKLEEQTKDGEINFVSERAQAVLVT